MLSLSHWENHRQSNLPKSFKLLTLSNSTCPSTHIFQIILIIYFSRTRQNSQRERLCTKKAQKENWRNEERKDIWLIPSHAFTDYPRGFCLFLKHEEKSSPASCGKHPCARTLLIAVTSNLLGSTKSKTPCSEAKKGQ